jgi:hypothetical protein
MPAKCGLVALCFLQHGPTPARATWPIVVVEDNRSFPQPNYKTVALLARVGTRSVGIGGRAIVVFLVDTRVTVAEQRAAEMRIFATVDGGC